MTQEKIETFDRLRNELADIERRQGWMNEWAKTIKETKDGVSHVTIENKNGVCCLQKQISKEDAIREFNLYAKELANLRADIKRQIEAAELMTPFVDEMTRRFREECAKFPPPPPGYFYAPELSDAHFEGDRCVVDMAIKLQPIIRSEK